MKSLNQILILIGLLFITSNVFAEKDFMKFGKITDRDLAISVCPFDSSAGAVILGDIGKSTFEVEENGTKLNFSRHVRIKIFNKESLEKGNFNIYLYRGTGGDYEKTGSIKGAVYNIVNGKLEKTKLTTDNIFRENVNKNRDVVKITMPNVKEGSIIDLYYTTISPFIFNIEPWYFQHDIPTLKSKYEVGVIEWFNYKSWVEGYLIVDKSTKSTNKTFSFLRSSQFTPNGKGSLITGSERINFEAEVNYQTYFAENIPAFKDEPFITNPYDYYSSVHFELQWTKYPGSVVKSYTKEWKDINKLFNEDNNFGYTLKRDNHLNEIAESITAKETLPEYRAKLAYEHICEQMVWDGRYRKFAESTIKRAYNEKSGNSADINLNLVALCRLTGLEAYPVAVSTRSHGKIRPGYPNFSQFNHIIAAVKIEGKYLLMDAIDDNCPYNLLPPQSLNGQGRLINKAEGEWIDLYTNKANTEVYLGNLAIKEDMSLSGNLSLKAMNYGALNFRKEYKSEESQEDYIVELEERLDGINIEEFNVRNLDSLHKPIVITSAINTSNGVHKMNNLMFFSPKVIGRMEENIFKQEERVYPIDYNYPIKEQYMFNIQLPEGYEVDELPKPLVMSLPENKGRYVYVVKAVGNTLQLNCQFTINETIIPGGSYPEIKKFYELIVAKEAEQIVIKKTN